MWKKITATILAVVLVITTLNYVPDTTKAATSVDWSTLEYIGDGAGGYANQYKIYVEDSQCGVVNIQKPVFASEAGIYITLPGDVSSCSLSGYDIQGAGIAVHMSNFTAKETEFTISTASSTYNFVVYNENGLGEGEEATTKAPSVDGTELIPTESQSGTNSVGAVSSGEPYSVERKIEGLSVTANKWYVASYTVTCNVDKKFQLRLQENGSWADITGNNNASYHNTTVAAGQTVKVTYVFQCTTTTSAAVFDICMGYIEDTPADAAEVSFENISLKEYSSQPDAETGDVVVSGGGETTLLAPTNVAAYNFYAKSKGYQVVFTASEGAVSYNVYMDSSDVLATVTATDEYLDASVFSAYADGALHDLYLRAVDAEGNLSAKSSAAKVRVTSSSTTVQASNGISAVYVVTNSDDAITKPVKTPASLTVISGDGSIKDASYYGSIKLRGNSTSFADKPAYNISFDKKQEVMVGKEKGKKWCLLANAYEKTMVRNKLAMDFGAKLGNVAAPGEYYTDLYLDGVYKGTFVISEPAENGRAGVSYDETTDEVLFELENNDKDESSDGAAYYTTSKCGLRFVTEDCEDEVKALYAAGTTSIDGIRTALRASSTKFDNMCNTLETFETAVINTSSDEVFNYINIDSFVDTYVINELFQTIDFGYSSVKFYITYDAEGNPTINAGPLWDFDLSSGNSSFAENRTYDTFRGQIVNSWFANLMNNNTFKNAVIAKFKKMQPYIQNLYKDNQVGTNQIDVNANIMAASRIKNYTSKENGGAGWSESTADGAEYSIYPYSYSTVSPYSTYTYDQHIDYLKTWLENRDKWLCEQWGINYEESGDLELTSDDLEITGYQMTSTFGGEEGTIGLRVVYQTEQTVNNETPEEIGLVYGLDTDGTMTAADVVVGSDSEYVASFAATSEGKLDKQMGTSTTASYYAMTMNTGNDTVTTDAFTTKYFVKPYAKMSDGTYVYGKAYSYTVFKVANYLYQNNLISTKSTYDCLYNKVLHFVDSTYEQGDFDWNNTIVSSK